MRKDHYWATPACFRLKKKRDFESEEHPCYWCGESRKIDWKVIFCESCHGFECLVCGKCMCNMEDDQYEALRVLRHRYCCNSYYFKRPIKKEDKPLLDLVPNFVKALDYCRMKEGIAPR